MFNTQKLKELCENSNLSIVEIYNSEDLLKRNNGWINAVLTKNDKYFGYEFDAERTGEISNYVIKLSTLQISEQEHAETVKLLQVLSDVERVSDYCENIAEFAETMVEKKITFSEMGAQHLNEIMNEALASYKFALEAFKEGNRDKALKVIEKETIVDDMEVKLRNQHIKRLTNNECNTEAGIIFLDMLVVLERISDHARNIAEEVLGK